MLEEANKHMRVKAVSSHEPGLELAKYFQKNSSTPAQGHHVSKARDGGPLDPTVATRTAVQTPVHWLVVDGGLAKP